MAPRRPRLRVAPGHVLVVAFLAVVAVGAGLSAVSPVRLRPPERPPRTATTVALPTPVQNARLIDRQAYIVAVTPGDAPLSRVAIPTVAGEDTIPDVLSRDLPVLLGDTAAIGLDWVGARLHRAWLWDRRRHVLTELPLPDDLPRGGAIAALSPDGRHLAYVAEHPCGRRSCARLMVRAWPTRRLVFTRVLSDVSWGDAHDPRDVARWLDGDRVAFELYDDQQGTRTVAEVYVGRLGLEVQRQAIPVLAPSA